MRSKRYYRIKEIITKTGKKWDKLAPVKNEAISFANRYLNEEPYEKTEDNSFSLEYCLARHGERINAHYRGKRSKDDIDKAVSNMLMNYTTKKDMVVYRGVCDRVFDEMIESAQYYPDTDFFERAFLLTSLVKGHELKYEKRLRIFVPAGTHAVYLGNLNNDLEYYTVAIQHGAYLKVVSMDRTYINCILVKTS